LEGLLGRAATGWLVDLDVAASRARYRNDPRGEGTRVPGSVNRVVSAGVTWADAGSPWSAQFQLRHFGPRDLAGDGSVRSRGTTLAYLRGGWRVTQKVTVNVDVFNLFDREASDIDYLYDSAPAGATAGERVHFHPVEPRTVRLTVAMSFR
jgi:outer membrane receptor protein involved in Fe transport